MLLHLVQEAVKAGAEHLLTINLYGTFFADASWVCGRHVLPLAYNV